MHNNGCFGTVVTVLVTSTKLSYKRPVTTGIGDHIWVYHPGI